jgi:hypothetical protein
MEKHYKITRPIYIRYGCVVPTVFKTTTYTISSVSYERFYRFYVQKLCC